MVGRNSVGGWRRRLLNGMKDCEEGGNKWLGVITSLGERRCEYRVEAGGRGVGGRG